MKARGYNEPIEKALNAYLEKNPRAPEGLYGPVKYIISLGGKRMRPQLVLMACEMFGGKTEDALPAAIAIELFHNFTLVHDDIIDRAPLRRGKPTVHEKWNSNTAILSGDVMLVHAYRALEELREENVSSILSVFNRTAALVCEGQQLDTDFETQQQVSIAQYLKMIELKTAVLLGAALQIGALAGGANEKEAERLSGFGCAAGIAFQLKDDLLDVYGDENKFGKQKGGDIIVNKKTFLLIKALELCSPYQKEELLNWMQAGASNAIEKVKAVTAIYDSLNVKTVCEKEMELHHHRALRLLSEVKLDADKKYPLEAFISEMMGREQ